MVLDTNALIFDALTPDRLTAAARDAIDEGQSARSLACCDITLWEIAMLVVKGRIRLPADTAAFLHDALTARSIRVLPITPEIAALSQTGSFPAGDPADRLIAATVVHHKARLITSDSALLRMEALPTLW